MLALARSCSLGLVRSCSSFLVQKLLGLCSRERWREHTVVGVALSAARPALPARASPRNLILITILLFLSSEPQLQQLRKRGPPPPPPPPPSPPTCRVYLSSALFSFSCFSFPSLSVSLSSFDERRTLVPEIDEVAHRARARTAQKTRVLAAIFSRAGETAFSPGGRETLSL